MAEKEELKELLTFMANKGFVWGPEPEIYGGVSGFYTYGPLGKLLKNHVEAAIRKTFHKHQMFEVECPTVLPRIVWEASGHDQETWPSLEGCPRTCARTAGRSALENLGRWIERSSPCRWEAHGQVRSCPVQTPPLQCATW